MYTLVQSQPSRMQGHINEYSLDWEEWKYIHVHIERNAQIQPLYNEEAERLHQWDYTLNIDSNPKHEAHK